MSVRESYTARDRERENGDGGDGTLLSCINHIRKEWCCAMCAHQKHGEDQRRCANARRKKKEMNCKKTLGFLLPGECQVICFVIPLHIFCSRENEPAERERDKNESILLLL